MNATLWAPEHTLTTAEESNLILQDVFDKDSTGMDDIILELCEDNSIAFDWELNGDEIHSLIIENEDALHHVYADYLLDFTRELMIRLTSEIDPVTL